MLLQGIANIVFSYNECANVSTKGIIYTMQCIILSSIANLLTSCLHIFIVYHYHLKKCFLY
ncbi:40S ribosomal protein S26-2-like [Iris pallida]|uniref:40S ribosomal protein S26-2-like n=1 Tax=Iris pallida TaxID=29817 RepID=A0AAX6GTM9_IRIPA|nr:40S ribosomal protein S26-2-like [Iris pallida]